MQPQSSGIKPETYIISVRSEVSETDRVLISDGLDAFNTSKAGVQDATPLAVLVRDLVTGDVIGGPLGRNFLSLAFFDLVYLPEAIRGAGLGTAIVQSAEQGAIRRGCISGFC